MLFIIPIFIGVALIADLGIRYFGSHLRPSISLLALYGGAIALAVVISVLLSEYYKGKKNSNLIIPKGTKGLAVVAFFFNTFWLLKILYIFFLSGHADNSLLIGYFIALLLINLSFMGYYLWLHKKGTNQKP